MTRAGTGGTARQFKAFADSLGEPVDVDLLFEDRRRWGWVRCATRGRLCKRFKAILLLFERDGVLQSSIAQRRVYGRVALLASKGLVSLRAFPHKGIEDGCAVAVRAVVLEKGIQRREAWLKVQKPKAERHRERLYGEVVFCILTRLHQFQECLVVRRHKCARRVDELGNAARKEGGCEKELLARLLDEAHALVLSQLGSVGQADCERSQQPGLHVPHRFEVLHAAVAGERQAHCLFAVRVVAAQAVRGQPPPLARGFAREANRSLIDAFVEPAGRFVLRNCFEQWYDGP